MDIRLKDRNTALEAICQMVLMEHGEDANDFYLYILKTARIREEEYFGHLVSNDLISILWDIRAEHKTDAMAADDALSVSSAQEQPQMPSVLRAARRKRTPVRSLPLSVLTMARSPKSSSSR